MENFLDTCILISYADKKDSLHNAAKKFIAANKDFIISYYQEKKEFSFLFFRKEKILIEALKASVLASYRPNTRYLTTKDQIILSKMIAKIKLGQLSQSQLLILRKQLQFFRQRFFNFVRNKISHIVIPLSEIDIVLVKRLFDIIHNEADSNILASAIQEHNRKGRELRIITADKQDWKSEYLSRAVQGTGYKHLPDITYLDS